MKLTYFTTQTDWKDSCQRIAKRKGEEGRASSNRKKKY